MTLPTNYADGNTLHGTDVDTWTTAINALTNNDVPGLTSTNTSSLPITLTSASTGMQVFTGSTAGILTLPTTSVAAGATWQINNQSTANITVNASGGATVDIVPPNNYGIFVAQQATPTLATHWLDNLIVAPTLATTNTSSLPITLNVGSARMQVFTGSTVGTLTLPTTSIVAGGQFAVINQSTAAITVQSSGANTVLILAGGTSAVFTARIATPTAAADWDPQYGGVAVLAGKILNVSNTMTLAAAVDGQTYTFPASGTSPAPAASTIAGWDANSNLSCNNVMQGQYSQAASASTLTLTITTPETVIITGSGGQTQLITLPTTSVPIGADWTVINQNNAAVTIQSSAGNTIIVLPGSASAPYSSAEFTALKATPTANTDWNYQFWGSQLKVTPVTLTTTVAPTTTLIPVAAMIIPAASVAAGQSFKLKVFGVQSATSGSVSYVIRIGTATTTAGSTGVCTANPLVAASTGAYFEGLLTCRTAGTASGYVMASGVGIPTAVLSTATTSLTTAIQVSTQTATVSYNTTAQNYVSVAVATSAGTHTIQQAYIAWAEG